MSNRPYSENEDHQETDDMLRDGDPEIVHYRGGYHNAALNIKREIDRSLNQPITAAPQVPLREWMTLMGINVGGRD